MSYSIKILKYGSQVVPGPQVFFQAGWERRVTFDFYVFLIQGEGITAVVDCGMDDASAINSLISSGLGADYQISTRADRKGVAELLAGEGVSLDDVDYVALTHFHSDHVSNVALFPRARFLISEAGWSGLQELRKSIPKMIADPIFPVASIDFIERLIGERVDLLQDGATPMPGVSIKHLGGHTVDSAAFSIPTGEGHVIIPGDTIWTYENLETDTPIGAAVNIAECFRAMSWARQTADLILPTHDSLLLSRYPEGIRA